MTFTSVLWVLLLVSSICQFAVGKTHRFDFDASWVQANPDGMKDRQMIGFNGIWPIPDIHVHKGDRIELLLTNNLGEGYHTSLHFHGLFMNTSDGNLIQMDGPEMVTQCPIQNGDSYLYNFTVSDQVGTYWYHAHSGSQYGDGMRAALIIHDDNEPFEYDEDLVIALSDLYHQTSQEINKSFLSRYNPTGAEPIPQNILFNNTLNATLDFEFDKTYLLRFINTGLFVSQYIALEDHEMTIVEVDGVYVKPTVTNLIYLASGQRMAVLVKSKKSNPGKNFALMQIMDESMLDIVPDELQRNRTNVISYGKNLENPDEYIVKDFDAATNDFLLRPIEEIPLLEDYDVQIKLNVKMDVLGDGITYSFFNDKTYARPKVPTLTSLLTSGKLASDAKIYGDNINAHILQAGEVVELVLNNYDPGRHPFHLHGHNFQIVQKSPAYEQDEDAVPQLDQDELTVPYNESSPSMPFPDYPMIRDTVVLEPNGHLVIRFKADNPGVWLFHCHINWHVDQGLAAVFIEDPQTLQERESLSSNYLNICSSGNIPNSGNAAGHSDDWFNFEGLPRQMLPLPTGFTSKGYFAFAISTLVGLWGLYTITQYGLQEDIYDDNEVHDRLSKILKDNNIELNEVNE